ncbi:CBS domain-containing protein [Metallosphaera tengchongensis]|nr:CBS domain-containing protein [Metallosphaera tengchongensis]
MREMAGLTQYELARRVGVSQSLIAKIESGKIDPKLSIIKKILDELVPLVEVNDSAVNIMHRPVICVKTSETIRNIVTMMEEHNISQIPVVNSHDKLVGMIYDFILMRKLALPSSKGFRASDVMAPLPPLVSPSTPISQIMKLLTKHSVTLVVEGDLIPVGIITRSDLIGYLSRK